MFLLSCKGSAAERVWSLGRDSLCCCCSGASDPHPVKLCTCGPAARHVLWLCHLTEYEVLGDGPEADCVLEGIPAGLFLAHHLRLPGRGLCWVAGQEGIIFVVLQTVQRL